MSEFYTTIIVWVVALSLAVGLAILAGNFAERKGYSYSMGFFLSFVLSPLTACIVLSMLPERIQGASKVNPELLLEIELEKARMMAAKLNGLA